ncbi:MAG TPA: four-helix bundle copper-binding protein, partial [Ohtaekwangia sp.]|nr:four-helix bundle copper-binding protein [Ohtaekwangia sp.]
MIDNSHQTCIDACLACALECEQCVSACLNEPDLQILTRCIELDRECSLACFASARLMSMGGEHATT